LISALASALESTWDVRKPCAIDSKKKQRHSLGRAIEDRNALRHGRIEV
jgi:hypothetical protein